MEKEKKTSYQYRQLKHISEATLLEEASHIKLILRGILVVFALVVVFLIWSSFVKIQEMTTTFGQLVPEGQVQTVQHLEGGIVNQVLVNDGDQVKKGQLLAVLSSSAQKAELDQLRSREVSLTLESERLNTFLKNKPANTALWAEKVVKSKYNPVKYKSQINTLLQDHKRLLDSQYVKIADQTEVLRSTVQQRQEKLKELKQKKSIWKKHLRLLSEEFDMYQRLKKDNYVSHKDYLTILRAVNQAKGDGAQIDSEIEQTEDAIQEAQSKLNEIISNESESALKTLSTVSADLLEVRHKIEKLEERVARTDVKAPIAGTVKGVSVFAGNVVKPGGILMEIVPHTGKLMAESRILPREIGHISVGDEVKVKILTYDYARYGSIAGKLENISASTFMDSENRPYYKAKISLTQQHIGTNKNLRQLKAGMTLQADIVTGEKTLMQYLLKPIHRSVSESFKER